MLRAIALVSLGIVLQVREKALIRGLRGHIPSCLDCRQRVLRSESIGSNQPNEIPVADKFHAGKLFRDAGVDRDKSRVKSIRTKHRAKHHLRQGNVRGILVFPGHEVAPLSFGNSGSSNLPLRNSREALGVGDSLYQLLAAGNFAVSKRSRIQRIGNFAFSG